MAVCAASYRIAFVLRHLPLFLHACASLCTLQLYALASINDMHPFFAVGSIMSVFSTSVSIRTKANLVAFGVFVLGLSALLFAVELFPLLGVERNRPAAHAVNRQRALDCTAARS